MFDYVDGAAGSETAARQNRQTIDSIKLMPRVLVNVENRVLSKSLLGRQYDLPFGIAPMGMCNLTWPGSDQMLGEVARQRNLPVCLSTLASSSLEDMRIWAGDNVFFQLYVGQSEAVAMQLASRAKEAGYGVMLLTVDVPQVAHRIRDLKNGFGTPVKLGPRQVLDFALHPEWSLRTLKAGVPDTANFSPETGTAAFSRHESRGRIDWEFLARLRDFWPGKLVVKGVLSAEDAVRCRDAGVDAVYVSNHGGRQLDSAPAAIQMLPLIRNAVGIDFPLIFDSGIRSGEAIIKALALGADFVMLGRPFLYAIGAAGQQGLDRVVSLLEQEVGLTLAQLGCPDINSIDWRILVDPDQVNIGSAH